MRSVKSAGGLTRVCDFEVSSRTQWLLSMPACSEINCTMQELIDPQYGTSEQHKESTDVRQFRDNKDTTDFKQQRRLVTAARGTSVDNKGLFKFELSRHPFGLFDRSGLLREPDKVSLADAICNMAKCSTILPDLPQEVDALLGQQHAIDGGSLFERICSMCVDFVQRKYPKPVVAFDGYASGPSAKDMTNHRPAGGVVGAAVNFSSDMPISSKKDIFLSNPVIEQRFILMFSKMFQKKAISSIVCDGDADVTIKTLVQSPGECVSWRWRQNII
ncbi:hypothetical protein ElyMa_002006600 [Elysia marginata]|uniref:Uncharacterized protein n=1 Tax=Elysia marginata TaxID=1093978 RepID=A0AAV4F3X0_9GAST|nr:hypothetical protein ElyMa_002006600 [Elysia marginata]